MSQIKGSETVATLDQAKASYEQQSTWERQLLEENEQGDLKLPSCYSSPSSIDAWRHDRMYDFILPLIQNDPDASWVTIGDGRFGSDAFSLGDRGAKVLATSLTDDSLKIAKDKGFIKNYKAINAEKIDLPDNSYDYVFCKEAYHHFPRPPIAFYEMLRVARKAVILIEPQRTRIRLLDTAKSLIKKLIRGDKTELFEESGNYIYRTNTDQIKDMMLALNMRTISYKRFNDFFHPKISRKDKSDKKAWYLTKLGIGIQDGFSALRLMDYGLACVVVFQENANPNLSKILKNTGYKKETLPKNPYI